MGLIFHNLIKFQDTDDIIRKNMKVLEDYEEIRLSEASGTISAEDVYSRNNLPLFSRSQVDGYAILASDITGASLLLLLCLFPWMRVLPCFLNQPLNVR